MTETVVELDLVGYSTIAQTLEQGLDVETSSKLNAQIQMFVDEGLRVVGATRQDAVMKTTGDGAILVFERPSDAHNFAAAVSEATRIHNRQKTEPLGKRVFRVGIATGDLVKKAKPAGGYEIAGMTIARAVRLETNAKPGEVLVDAVTFEALTPDQQRRYAAKERVAGKRDEVFCAHRCLLDPDGPKDAESFCPDTASRARSAPSPTAPELLHRRPWPRWFKASTILGALVLTGILIAWLFPRQSAGPSIAVTTSGPSSPGVVNGPVIYNQNDMSDEKILAIVEHNRQKPREDEVSQAEARTLVPDRDKTIESLRDALRRAQVRADAGDNAAAQAIGEARESRDVARLQAVLELEADRLGRAPEPDSAQVRALLREAAAIAMLRGEFGAARRHLNKLLSLSADDAAALNELGRICLLEGNPDEAESFYGKSLRSSGATDASSAIALGNMGVISLGRRDFGGARDLLQQSLAVEERLGRSEGIAADCSNLASTYLHEGDLSEAESLLRRAIELEEHSRYPENVGTYRGNLALVFRDRGDLDQASALLLDAIATDRRLGRVDNVVRHLGNLGAIFEIRRQFDGAQRCFEQAFVLSSQWGLALQAAKYSSLLAQVRRTAGQYGTTDPVSDRPTVLYGSFGVIELNPRGATPQELAGLAREEQDLREALARSESSGLAEGIAVNCGNLGINQLRQSNFAEARRMLLRAYAEYEKLKDGAGMSRQCDNLGVVCVWVNDFVDAQAWFDRCLTQARAAGARELEAQCYRHLSWLSSKKGDSEGAVSMCQSSYDFCRDNGDERGIGQACEIFAVIAEVQNKLEAAEKYRREALERYERAGDLLHLADALAALGLVQQKRGDLSSAEQSYQRALFENLKLNRLPERGHILVNLGLLNEQMGHVDLAQRCLTQARDLFIYSGDPLGQANAHAALAAVFEDLGEVRAVRDNWTKARDLFGQSGNPTMVAQINQWLGELPEPGASTQETPPR